ncbi:copper chaperone PCu(A)C [Gemmatimonas sp.]|jgi:copper(I)-binding protein|uniref:copper chaperone PCu(A)C n=1 Tax=Gemmatimonas sp. TaxID=1962908 RepID=UPI0037BFB8D3
MRSRYLPLAVLLSLVAACTTADVPASGHRVSASWARTADSGTTGGVYVTIVNADSTPVDLTGASTPYATATEVHESMMHEGMSHMMARPSITIAGRDSLVMKPGGLHIMLLQLTRALVTTDSIPLTLRFSTGDSLVVRVPVQAP